LVAKRKKLHTTGGDIIASNGHEIVRSCSCCKIWGIPAVPLSKNRIMQVIESLWRDVKEQLQTRVKRSTEFALQIDESAYIGKSSCSAYRFQRDVHGVIY
jgi:hypothetical protein